MTSNEDTLGASGEVIDELSAGAILNRIPAMQDGADQELQKLSAVHNLFPALVECFGIILMGYLAGR